MLIKITLSTKIIFNYEKIQITKKIKNRISWQNIVSNSSLERFWLHF
jgi:hypothetical protein